MTTSKELARRPKILYASYFRMTQLSVPRLHWPSRSNGCSWGIAKVLTALIYPDWLHSLSGENTRMMFDPSVALKTSYRAGSCQEFDLAWSSLSFSFTCQSIRLEMDSSCRSIRLEIDSFCQSAVDLNFEESKPQANQLLVNVRVQMHSTGTHAGRRGGTGDADFTGVEDNSTVLCKKQSQAIQQQYFIQVSAKKIVFLINKSWILQVNLATVFKIYSRKKCLCLKHWC